MRSLILNVSFATCLMLAFACTKSSPVVSTVTDVYVSGDSTTTGYNTVVKYWKNEVPFDCSDGTQQAFSQSIAVSGSNIFVVGITSNSTQSFAMAWKNGAGVQLTNGGFESIATSVKVSGNDVYYAGSRGNSISTSFATYWKNGIPISVSDGTQACIVTDMVVDGTDLYLLIQQYSGQSVGGIWKNGVFTTLSAGLTGYTNQYDAMAESKGNIYLAATVYKESTGTSIAQYFKDGIPTKLSDSTNNGSTSGIFITGNDVYVSGALSKGTALSPETIQIATYWKNGKAVYLTDGTHNASTTSITVIGKDVYVTGNESNGTVNIAKYWKNGKAVLLSNGTKDSNTSSIVVIQH